MGRILRVILRHGDSWLEVKGLHKIESSSRKRGSSRKKRSSLYSIVAESVRKPSVKKYRYKREVKVPATQVSKFITRIFRHNTSVLVLIEALDDEYYLAKIYSSSKREIEKATKLISLVLEKIVKPQREGGEEEEE